MLLIRRKPDAIQDLWHRIVTEFFPTSGYQPTCEMDIEAYTKGDMGSADYRSEIWVPVKIISIRQKEYGQ